MQGLRPAHDSSQGLNRDPHSIVLWLLGFLGITIGGGLLGAIVYLIVAAVILLISDRFLSGLSVSGFGGAIIAAIAIGVVTWLVGWLLGLLGISF